MSGQNAPPPPLEGGGRGEGWERYKVARAKELRLHSTFPERKIWQAIRAPISGVKFRRQVPIGPYIVDFFCPAAGLIVEVDGITHVNSDVDIERDVWLRSRGYTVLRFWNNEVTANLDGVVQMILDAARGITPPPGPLPQGEGEVLP